MQDLGLRDMAQFEGWVQPPAAQPEVPESEVDEFQGRSEEDITRELSVRAEAEDDRPLQSLMPLEEVIAGFASLPLPMALVF